MKKKFLDELRGYLSLLSEEEREEILRFYEERFETGVRYEGKSEEDVVDELESPRQIADNVLREYGYSRVRRAAEEEKKVSTASVVGIVIFDVFIASVVVSVLFGLLSGFASGFAAFVGGGFFSVLFGEGQRSVWEVMLGVGIAYIWLLFVLWLYDLLVGFVIWLVRWHMDVFRTAKSSGLVKSLKNFQFSAFIRKKPGLRRLKSMMTFIALVFIIGGLFAGFSTTGTIALGRFNEPLETHEYEMDVSGDISADEVWVITSDLDLGDIRVIRTAGTTIQVVSRERESVPVTVDIDGQSRHIHFENTLSNTFFNINFFGLLSRNAPGITIEIPQDLSIDTIALEGMNGAVVVDGFDLASLEIATTNASITLRNLNIVDHLDVAATNGSITVRGSAAATSELTLTNGKIIVRQSDIRTLVARTTNGEIALRELNSDSRNGDSVYGRTTNGKVTLNDVYSLDVELRTTNGGIDFINSDTGFVLDRLETQTTNGSVNSNVPVKP